MFFLQMVNDMFITEKQRHANNDDDDADTRYY